MRTGLCGPTCVVNAMCGPHTKALIIGCGQGAASMVIRVSTSKLAFAKMGRIANIPILCERAGPALQPLLLNAMESHSAVFGVQKRDAWQHRGSPQTSSRAILPYEFGHTRQWLSSAALYLARSTQHCSLRLHLRVKSTFCLELRIVLFCFVLEWYVVDF